jgi:hypothetical protein
METLEEVSCNAERNGGAPGIDGQNIEDIEAQERSLFCGARERPCHRQVQTQTESPVSIRQGCLNLLRRADIVGCSLVHSERRTTDELQNDIFILFRQSAGASAAPFRALA